MSDMKISQDLIDFIKLAEGCKLTAYQDSAGIFTIGYGHAGVHSGMVISNDQALQLLQNDLYKVQLAVNDLLEVDVTQGQFNALCDFAFNCGSGNLQKSTLLEDINSGNLADVDVQFPRWDRSGGVVIDGLLKRRLAEDAMFNGRDWESILRGK